MLNKQQLLQVLNMQREKMLLAFRDSLITKEIYFASINVIDKIEHECDRLFIEQKK